MSVVKEKVVCWLRGDTKCRSLKRRQSTSCAEIPNVGR
jgi:hypothetical protein